MGLRRVRRDDDRGDPVARAGLVALARRRSGGEDAVAVGRRADAFLDRVRSTGSDAVVFAHGHLLRVLAARWIEMPPIEGRRLPLDTAHYGILGHERETPGILLWNAG